MTEVDGSEEHDGSWQPPSVASGLVVAPGSLGLVRGRRRLGSLALLVLVFVVTFFVGGQLSFDPVKDEPHFWESATHFSGEFPPTAEQLRSVREVVTPLALILWGQIERFAGVGLFLPRLLNLSLSALIVLSIAWRAREDDEAPLLAAIGVLSFPYYLPMGVHLYTDIVAAFFVYLGWRLLGERRMLGAALALTLAIATRQYMVVFCTALVAQIGIEGLRGPRQRWLDAWPPALAGSSLLLWFAFYGGLGPPGGIDEWIPLYPSPMMQAFDFIVEYGLYALTCIGVYYVIPEYALFRVLYKDLGDPRALLTRRNLAYAAVIAIAFAVFPTTFLDHHQGAFDRATKILFPIGFVRCAVHAVLAWLTVVRFASRLDLAFFLVFFQWLIMMKVQLSWDKYLLPLFVVLWTLRAFRLTPGGVFPPLRERAKG